jgi:hypothetical protein
VSALLVSLDLDDAWAYQRARGLPGWRDAPTVLPLAGERFREVLSLADVPAATVFVVGRDARLTHGRAAVRAFARDGLEIADHSFGHRGELATRPMTEIRDDLVASRTAIAEVTGVLPDGFRCPSFGTSRRLTRTLRALGYRYDASALPTTLLPALRVYHRLVAGRSSHAPTYGSVRTAFGSLRPRHRRGLSTIPTTTLPGARLPFHGSYLSALAVRSLPAAQAYLRVVDHRLRAGSIPVSFLLHPTDLLDRDDAPQLAFFPGMALPWARKRDLMVGALRRLHQGRSALTLQAASERLAAVKGTADASGRSPDLARASGRSSDPARASGRPRALR